MQAEEKLNEARYFLDLLKSTPQDNAHEKEFMYILSAFLSSWRSVFDIMLYDYAEKFSLGLSREEVITERDFEVAARATNNTQALSFLRWWRQQVNLLAHNPLWAKRKIIVHRGYPPTMRVFTVFVSGSIAMSSTFTISRTSGATITPSSPSAISPATTTWTNTIGGSAIATTTPTETRSEIRFSDCQDRGVIDYCQQAFDKMESIVSSAILQFGRL